MRILVADDNPTSLLLLRRAVEHLGHECHSARDGREAWSRFQKAEYDVVISDWMMPEVDGLELCRLIRSHVTPQYPYFIFVSALDDKEHFVEAMEVGADDYLGKPFDRVDLQARLVAASRVTTLYRQIANQRSELEHQALHDGLTGLPNRTLLYDRVEQAILAARRAGEGFSLLMLDLDCFKEINDTLGHHHGDLALVEVARRLRSTLRESDTIARLGGDEIAVVLPQADREAAGRIAQKIGLVLAQTIRLDGQELEMGSSVGIALFPEHGESVEALLRHADVAMYEAKRAGGGFAIFEEVDDMASAARLALPAELRRAILSGQLALHYQPQVNLRTGNVDGVEALLRWHHPVHGMMLPDRFIPLAEKGGMMKRLSTWVLGEAIQQVRSWRDSGLELAVSVNLSARNLHDLDFASTVQDLLQTWEADPSWLRVEITESALMVDSERAAETVRRLHALGIRISVDDFGTGYSSLSFLRNLPLDEIKIDKSFVMDMLSSRDDGLIVRTLLDLGHSLGLQVVPEGVESRQLVDVLSALGCHLGQGYYLSRPMPAEELTELLLARTHAASA